MVIVLAFPMCVIGVAADDANVLLSELSDEESIAFLKAKGVEIPDDFEDELEWGPFVKEIIALVEKNPEITLAYNYSVTHAFANAIKRVVNEYYGVTAVTLPARNTRVVDPVLLHSEVYGAWNDNFENYNCYAYALDITNDWLDPGNKSGFVYSLSLSVYTVAEYVKADLEELGCTNVTITATRPTTSTQNVHQKAICVRIKGGVDYHFMKLDGNSWYHKPGNSNTLRYKYLPSEDLTWTNESSYRGRVYLATVEYTSAIRYITYNTPHDYEYEYCGSNQHIRTCTICHGTTGSAASCRYVNGYCRVCGNQQPILPTSNKFDAISLTE